MAITRDLTFATIYTDQGIELGDTLTYTTLNDGTTSLTATVAELNTLDGITATTAELNYVDGVTSNLQTQLDAKLPLAGGTMTGNIVMSGAQTVDGRDLSADGTKLDGIESGATADQTASEILTALLTVDGTTSGLDADLLDGQQGSYYAPIASPTFTGTPLAPTAAAATNTTQIATTAFVQTAVSNLVDAAPSTLDTLNELAAALGDDANFSTTVTNSIATKVPLAGGTMTGNLDFGDSVYARFGASQDLQIYHDGTHSYIQDAGTGNLKLKGQQVSVEAPSGSLNLYCTADGDTRLYYNNSLKLATTSTGIDITGTVTSDGLLVQGGAAARPTFTHASGYGALQVAGVSASSGAGIIFANDYNTAVSEEYSIYLDGLTDSLVFISGDPADIATEERMRITSAGNVGIGTTSPSVALEVDGIIASINSNQGTEQLQLQGYGGSAYINMNGSGALIFRMGTGYSEKMRIDSSGNLLVGTTTLNSGTLGSTNTFAELAGPANGSGTLILSRQSNTNNDEVGGIRFVNSNNFDDDGLDADGKLIATISGRTATSDSNASDDAGGYLTFSTKPEAGNHAERMRIDSSGRVGIGTDSPQTKFVVSASASQNIEISGSWIQSFNRSTPGYARMSFYGSSYDFNNGNVGIGETSPDAKLEIANGSTAMPGLHIKGSNGSATANKGIGVGPWILLDNTAIGTSTGYPKTAGIVYQASNSDNGYTTNSGQDYAYIMFNRTNSPSNNSTQIEFGTQLTNGAADTKMLIDPNGNVGIGTTSPTNTSGYTTLNIGASTVGSILKLDGATSGHYDRIFSNDGQLLIQADQGNVKADSDILFYTDSTEKMRIESNGNVGIGTTSPGTILHLAGAGEGLYLSRANGQTPHIRTRHQNSAIGSQTASNDGNRVGQLSFEPYTSSSGWMEMTGIFGVVNGTVTSTAAPVDLVMSAGSSGNIASNEKMRILSNGRVGINESSPEVRLHVKASDSGNSTLASNTVALFENNTSSIISVRHPSDGGHRSGIAFMDNNIGGFILHGDGTSGDGLWVKGYTFVDIHTGTNNNVDPTTSTHHARFNSSGMTLYKNGASTTIWTDTNRTGMGANSSSYLWVDNLHVYNWRGTLDRAWDDYPSITIQNDTANGPQGEFRIHGINGVSGSDFSITTRCDGGYATGSDSRRKTNIESVTNALDIVNQLDGKKFNIVNSELEIQEDLSMEATGKKFGFLAQDVKSIIPEAVKYYENEDKPNENGWATAYSMDYGSLIALLTNAIKEQQTIIEDLKARIEAIENA